MPENAASIRVLLKAGFVEKGYEPSLERNRYVVTASDAAGVVFDDLMYISIESPDQREVLQLIKELDDYQRPLYPAESHHGISIGELTKSNALFAVDRQCDGHAVGCGAIVIEAGHGELKRMYTHPSQRGKSIARALLSVLEQRAVEQGCTAFALETGYLQPESIALYARHGYERCGPFGAYVDDPNSVFMRKIASAQGLAQVQP